MRFLVLDFHFTAKKRIFCDSCTKFCWNYKHTRQIAGKKPPLTPIALLGLKEKKISTKIDFCTKTFLSAIYSDVIS